MAYYTIKVPYLAPIPVGHRIAVEVYVRNVGLFGTKVEPDPSMPTLVDVETGIRWQGSIVELEDPHRALHRTYHGCVLACEIITSGGSHASFKSLLTIDPMEPPGAA